jgi:hypothetical protein
MSDINEYLQYLGSELAKLRGRVAQLERQEALFDFTTWVPTVTQTVSVTQFTATYARYATIGRLVVVTAKLVMTTGAAGTSGGSIVVGGLPISIANCTATTDDLGSAVIYDSGVAYYQGSAVRGSATAIGFRSHNTANPVGADPTFGLAINDVISFTICYER